MKINSITTNTGYPKSNSLAKWSADKHERTEQNQKNEYYKINTTIKSNSDGRASFKGGVPLLHRAASFASDYPIVAEAAFALLITCGLRPLCIMATAKNEEDKEKCSYQAAKSVASGVVGLVMSAIIGSTIALATKNANKNGAFKMPEEMKAKSQELVKQGVDALTNLGKKLTTDGSASELTQQISALTDGGKMNLSIFKKAGKGAQKLFQEKIKEVAPEISDTVSRALKEQQIINNYAKTGKNVMDKLFQPIFMPLRANVTVALIPFILGLFGLKKGGSKPKEQEQENLLKTLNYEVFQTSTEKEIFKSFLEVTNNESK